MSDPKKPTLNQIYDDTISLIMQEMTKVKPDSDEYAAMAKNVETLARAKSCEKDDSIDKNTILTVGANLLGVLLILGYEHGHVITSKAIGFIPKLRP